MISPNQSLQTENMSGSHHTRKHSDTYTIKSGQGKERYPEISIQILNEAIKQDILPASYKDKLITNPNKYSVFFAKFDLNSPTTKQALKNCNFEESDAKTLSYYEFSSQTFSTLNNVVSYLYYLTEHYNKLKTIVNERNRLKKEKENLKKIRNSSNIIYTSQGFGNDSINDYEEQLSGWGQTSEVSKRAKHSLKSSNSKLNKSASQILEKSRTMKTLNDRKNISKMKYEKYTDVIDFVRNEKIEDLVSQKKYEEVDITIVEKKLVERQLKIQKEVEKKSKELGQKLKKAQENVRRNLERQEYIIEKKLVEIDATGEKYEEMKKKKEEQRQQELIKLKEMNLKQKAENLKKKEEKEFEELQRRKQLTQMLERKESNAENILRRFKQEHQHKFQTLNLKYQEIISNSYNLKENDGIHNIQKLCENETRRIQKVEDKEKALKRSIKLKQLEHQKKQDKLTKFLERVEIKNENKIEKIRDNLKNKFIRIDKVQDMQNEKSQTLSATNTRRHHQVQQNFANELYRYALLQEKVVRKHTDIDQRKQELSDSQHDFFNLTRSLSQDLFVKREEQFDKIK